MCVCVVVNSGNAIKSIGLFNSTICNIAHVNFHSRTLHLDIIKIFFACLPTDAQANCFKKNIKIYIKTAPTRFGAITIIRERII